MSCKQVIIDVLSGKQPPYVPWNFSFTKDAQEKLITHFGIPDLNIVTRPHLAGVSAYPPHIPVGNELYRDAYGVIWNRSRDKDIGVTENCLLNEPLLNNLKLPDPADQTQIKLLSEVCRQEQDKFIVYNIGFSLFERAWTLRSMENLMMDFYLNPGFVHELLDALADHNICMIRRALACNIDAVMFGDDWGQQRGLIMGPDLWRTFIKPRLSRMYQAVKRAGKFVFIHSCGDVDELFPELADCGLDCFNPFQPEVMDVEDLMIRYRGTLAFYGGISTQKSLPFGSTEDVRTEVRKMIRLGKQGGYILSPAHSIPGDVPLANMLAMIEEVIKSAQ
ncbi:MAG: uroporphyrinogen-III decarboxylase-like protein [Spirochaetes bacterium GWF1_41_5]|nr:MAG: uroporphyrinogen-III decarboxylase-like protein [Spirochaetes bacterium GWF1_41_5]HBE01623.1 uroporphyrinogen-III decarboxylase-like protein [Spirochaetia bacterium]